MLRAKNKQILAVLFIMVLLASGQRIYYEMAFTATKAASVVIREVNNDSIVFGVSQEQLKQIQTVYESGDKYNLPQAAIMDHISVKKTDSIVKVIFTKETSLGKWILVPRRIGETDKNYEERIAYRDMLIQDINLVNNEIKPPQGLHEVTAHINFTEYHGNMVKCRYRGEIVFLLRKLGISQWKVESVKTTPITII